MGPTKPSPKNRWRGTNVRTGIALLLIASSFFAGVLVFKLLGGAIIGITVLGAAIILFLVIAIGKNLRQETGN